MNIIEALQSEDFNLRITKDNRWLCGDNKGGWIIYEFKPYTKDTIVIIETNNETIAIANLLY